LLVVASAIDGESRHTKPAMAMHMVPTAASNPAYVPALVVQAQRLAGRVSPAKRLGARHLARPRRRRPLVNSRCSCTNFFAL
jgi:hypothetical protein